MTVELAVAIIVGSVGFIGLITGLITFFATRRKAARDEGALIARLELTIENNTMAMKSLETFSREINDRLIRLEEWRKSHCADERGGGL